MNIYLIMQDYNSTSETFDCAVVVAKNDDRAKCIHPAGKAFFVNGKWQIENETYVDEDDWVESPEYIEAILVGKALPTAEEGVILASFNAY